jgi:hypothetical protein
VVKLVAGARPRLSDPRTVLATYDARAVVVWQAHGAEVAEEAVRLGRFGGRLWRFDRMTRFRTSLPSLLARNGWATRPGRERILAVYVARDGFDALLRQAVHAAFEPAIYPSRMGWSLAVRFANVTVAWHPDVDPAGNELPRETLRVGVRDGALRSFTDQWVVGVEDFTDWVVAHRGCPRPDLAVPELREYPMDRGLHDRLAGRGGVRSEASSPVDPTER